MDCVLATKELDALAESEKAQEPAHEVLWSAGGYKSAHGREEHGVKRIVEPGIVDVSVWLSEVRDQEKEAQRRQHHGECPQRPSEPCGGDAVAHPTQSSLPFLCPFCHNTTLQHYRLPSVTATVTNEKIQGELRRIPIPRTWVNKGMKEGRDLKDSTLSLLSPASAGLISILRMEMEADLPKSSAGYHVAIAHARRRCQPRSHNRLQPHLSCPPTPSLCHRRKRLGPWLQDRCR